MNDPQSYAAVVAYDGREFFGWQRLADKPTIQGAIEVALHKAFGGQFMAQGAGRTDRSAHAEGQVVGFQLEQRLADDEVLAALNKVLPETIHLIEVRSVPSDFHARTSAVGKEYAYLIWNQSDIPDEMVNRVWHVPEPLMLEPMEEAIALLLGKNDFATFGTKMNFQQKTTVREIFSAEIDQVDEVITFRFQGNSFLNHMVRNMVRALVRVGEGKWSPSKVGEALNAKLRSASPGSAPASGLYLMQVFYPD
jgi:tRNA pseudouridine38-40 synthase